MKSKWRDIETAPEDGTEFLAKVRAVRGNEYVTVLLIEDGYYVTPTPHGKCMISTKPVGWQPLPSLK